MKEISVQELKEMKDRNEDFQLIDVREEYEYESANLNGELIPMSKLLDEVDKISKDKKVIIHCKSGGRSSVAVMQLEGKFGFDNLYNLKGGILAYKRDIDPNLEVI